MSAQQTPGASPSGYAFAEPQPSAGQNNFETPVHDSQYYDFLVKTAQAVPAPRVNPPIMALADVLGPAAVAAIQAGGQIVFHSVGDTGPTQGPSSIDEVAASMIEDFQAAPADRPSFFFHLGDVVYNFGEAPYYYEQFYEPYRNYPAPIFAIAGNHDGMVYQKETVPTLQAFLAQFCSPAPVHAPEAGALVRTTMAQPGVYFTLEAPFVTIIGLYSNALENPGVISSEGGTFPQIGDAQKSFLTSELVRLKGRPGAVLLAMHHPPYSGDAQHGGSPKMLQDLDDCCTQAGFWPHAVLSGHAHLYQRFARTVQGQSIPYIVAGCGGHNLQHLAGAPTGAVTTPLANSSGTVQMEKYLSVYGYLRITASAQQLAIKFHGAGSTASKSPLDQVVVDLKA